MLTRENEKGFGDVLTEAWIQAGRQCRALASRSGGGIGAVLEDRSEQGFSGL
jgi:hypothetical protein